MNIFFLDKCPIKAAKYLVNKHVVKMITESRQMMHIAHLHIQNPTIKITYRNHPCSIWVRKNRDNYLWLLEHALAIGQEYTFRYEKLHKSEVYIRENLMEPPDLPFLHPGITFPALSMPDHCKISDDYVDCYREYYRKEKSSLFVWKNRERPDWL
jgi:hypothetical protein